MYCILVINLFLTISSIADQEPNILFILTGQHFADAVSHVMRDKHKKTPNLDKLAKNSVRFSKAYATNPLCIPARNSIFTGYYPFEAGIQFNDSLVSMGIHFK